MNTRLCQNCIKSKPLPEFIPLPEFNIDKNQIGLEGYYMYCNTCIPIRKAQAIIDKKYFEQYELEHNQKKPQKEIEPPKTKLPEIELKDKTKLCRTCKITKLRDLYFDESKVTCDGFNHDCNLCKTEQQIKSKQQAKLTRLEYRKRNADYLKTYQRNYLKRYGNSDKAKANQKQWRMFNLDKYKLYQKQWRMDNQDKAKANQNKWRMANLDKYKLYQKQWRMDNQDRIKSYRNTFLSQ